MMRATVGMLVLAGLMLVPFVDGSLYKKGTPLNPETGLPEVRDPMQTEMEMLLENKGTNYFVHNQKPVTLSDNATKILQSMDAFEELKCNACLVSVVEIADALRNFWNELTKTETRKLKKQEAIDLLHSACAPGSILESFGLLVENGKTKNIFTPETQREFTAKAGYTVRNEKAVTRVLKETCKALLADYEGDFLVIIGRPRGHQTIELQSNLCGPEPGIGYCKALTPDWQDKAEIYNAEQHRKHEKEWMRNRDLYNSIQESEDPLAFLDDPTKEPPIEIRVLNEEL